MMIPKYNVIEVLFMLYSYVTHKHWSGFVYLFIHIHTFIYINLFDYINNTFIEG